MLQAGRTAVAEDTEIEHTQGRALAGRQERDLIDSLRLVLGQRLVLSERAPPDTLVPSEPDSLRHQGMTRARADCPAFDFQGIHDNHLRLGIPEPLRSAPSLV